MESRNSETSRFQIIELEERIAPAATGVLPSVLHAHENARGFQGAQNACHGL